MLIGGAGQFVGAGLGVLLNVNPGLYPLFLSNAVGRHKFLLAMNKVAFRQPQETVSQLQRELVDSYEASIQYFNELVAQGDGVVLHAFKGAIDFDQEKHALQIKKYLTLRNREWRNIGNWALTNGINILTGRSEIGKSSLLFFLTTYLDQAQIRYTEATSADTMDFAVLLTHGKADVLHSYIVDTLRQYQEGISISQIPTYAQKVLKETNIKELAKSLNDQIQLSIQSDVWVGWSDSFKAGTDITKLKPEQALIDTIVTQFLREKVKITTTEVLRGTNSLGAQQSIKFAKTILDPHAEVIILDETINNIDDVTKQSLVRQFAELVKQYHQNKIIVLTTHDATLLQLLQKYCTPEALVSIATMDETTVKAQTILDGDIAQIVMRERWNKLGTHFIKIINAVGQNKLSAELLREVYDSEIPRIVNTPQIKARLVAYLSILCAIASQAEAAKEITIESRSVLAKAMIEFIDNLDYDPLDTELEKELKNIKAYFASALLVVQFVGTHIVAQRYPNEEFLDQYEAGIMVRLESEIKIYHDEVAFMEFEGYVDKQQLQRKFPKINDHIGFVTWYKENFANLKDIPNKYKIQLQLWYTNQSVLTNPQTYADWYRSITEHPDATAGVLLSRVLQTQRDEPDMVQIALMYIATVKGISSKSKDFEAYIDRLIRNKLKWGLTGYSEEEQLILLNGLASLARTPEQLEYFYLHSLHVTLDSNFDFVGNNLMDLDNARKRYRLRPSFRTELRDNIKELEEKIARNGEFVRSLFAD